MILGLNWRGNFVMLSSRRQILRLWQASIAFVALPKWAGATDTASDKLLTMSAKSFEPLIGTTFTANANLLGPTWLRLHLIESLSPDPLIGRVGSIQRGAAQDVPTEAFALHFTAVGPALAEGTHELHHPMLGSIGLFIVHGPKEYVAVINHLLAPLPSSYQIPSAPAAKKA